jgi:hypothetical protein
VKRHSRSIPLRSEIAVAATAGFTSAAMLFACLVVPVPATARPLRASSAPAVTAGSARNGAASRSEPPHILARIAKAGAGEQPTSLAVAARALPGDTGAGSRIATGHRAWTPGEPHGCSLARGQPRTDALT